jgi:tetratricopeptide (TPR) repeat protein
MYKDAIRDFEKAKYEESLNREEDPQYFKANPGISDGLGRCYHYLGDYENALTHFENAIEADSQNKVFLMHRAQFYFDQEMYEESIRDLQKGLEISPSDSLLLYLLGLSYYADEKFKECLKTLKTALINLGDMEISVNYAPDIYYHIGLAYCMMEKFEKSIYPLSRVSCLLFIIF